MTINPQTRHNYAWALLIISIGLMSFVSLAVVYHKNATEQLSIDIIALQQALDQSTTMLAAADLDSGKSLYRNKALVAATGWTSNQLNDAGGPKACYADPNQWDEIVQAGKQGKFFDGYVIQRTRDGSLVNFRLRVTPVPSGHGRIVGVFSMTEMYCLAKCNVIGQ